MAKAREHLHAEAAVVGGGIAGLAAAYELQKLGISYRLIESSDRWGGKIATEQTDDGYIVERGADSVLDLKPHARELINELGLAAETITSHPHNRGAQLWHEGRLHPLPADWQILIPGRLAPFLASPLLLWPAKLRVAAERWQPSAPSDADETVAAFVRRRIGCDALEQLAEPILSHIHVGDIDRMSMASTYPSLTMVERRFGSLQAASSARPARAGVQFSSLQRGMQSMVASLVAKLDRSKLHLNRRAVSVTTGNTKTNRLCLGLDDGAVLAIDQLVLATPAATAAGLLETISAPSSDRLRRLRCSSIAAITVAYRKQDLVRPLKTFGAFVPRSANRRILACTWTSNKFAGRCPPGVVLIRAFVGGGENNRLGDLDELESIVTRELGELVGLVETGAKPERIWISRFDRGYPQYDVDHGRRIAKIEELSSARVLFAGSPYHGVGIPDCIASGQRAAKRIEQKKEFFEALRG